MTYSIQRAAELQVLLEGAPLPATPDELVRYAERQDGGDQFLTELRSLTKPEYETLDDVGEELAGAQPAAPALTSPVPRPESDLPPGGDDYVNPAPQSGRVRDDAPPDNPPQKALEQQ